MDKIIITAHGNTYTYTPVATTSCEAVAYEESIVAHGSTCEVSLAVNDSDGKLYRVKAYKDGYSSDLGYEIMTKLNQGSNHEGDNYILDPVLIGTSQIGESAPCSCEVFRYVEGNTIQPYQGQISIFENAGALFKILMVMDSILVSLKSIHSAGYVHFDVNHSNIFQFNVNERALAQLIDMGSCVEIADLIKIIEDGADVWELPSSTEPYYAENELNELCGLCGEELEQNIKVLDLKAAARVFFYMLGESDTQALDRNEGFQRALFEFRLKSEASITESFKDAEEMRFHIAGMISSICHKLPKSIYTEKKKAIFSNPTINALRDRYIKSHAPTTSGKKREDIFIDDILKDIDTSILPRIEKGNEKYKNLEELLYREKGNYLLTGEGGQGKSTSFLFSFLRSFLLNSEKLNDDCMILYVSMSNYTSNKLIETYIEDQSRFPISEFPAQNITLLLDALDEAKEFRLQEEDERRKFIEKFAEQIRELVKTGYRIVISSRYFPEEEFLPDFKRAKFLLLEDQQVEGYLKNDFASVRNSENLFNMLKNNFFLTIFKQIGLNAADVAKRDITAVELIELFFYRMFESKKQMMTSDEREIFEDDMDFVAEMAFSEDVLNRVSAKRRVQHYLISLNCFLPIIAIRQQDDGRWKISFSHMFFDDYFKARYVISCVRALLFGSKKTDEKDFSILRRSYSPEALTMASQMLNQNSQKNQADLKDRIECVFREIWTYKAEEARRREESLLEQRKTKVSLKEKIGHRFRSIFDREQKIEIKNVGLSGLLSIDSYGIIFDNFLRMISLFYEDFSEVDLTYWLCERKFPSFCGFKEARKIVFPKGVVTIPSDTFLGCENLTEIKVLDGVVEIGSGSFEDCASLCKIYIPVSVKKIENWAFGSCIALEQIIYSGTIEQWSFVQRAPSWRYLSSKDLKIICKDGEYDKECFLENGLETQEIGGKMKVVSIGKCQDEDITISDNIDEVGNRAFSGCVDIRRVMLNVERIEDFAFSTCLSLNTIKISSRLKEVGKYAFVEDEHIRDQRSVYFYGSLENWLEIAFYTNPCTGGAPLYLNDEILNEAILDMPEIKHNSFEGCLSLEKIYLKRNVRKISEKAFYGCKNLSYIEFEGKISELKHIDFASDWCGLTAVNSIICRDGIVPIDDWVNNEPINLRYECNSDGTYSVAGVELKKSLNPSDDGDNVENLINYYFHEPMIIPQYFRGCLVTKILSSTFVNVSISDIYLPKSIQMIEVNDLKQLLYLRLYLHFFGTIEEWKRIKKEIPIVYDFKWCTLYCFDGELYGDEIFITN